MATWKTILICVFEIMGSPNRRGSLFAIEKEKNHNSAGNDNVKIHQYFHSLRHRRN